MLVALGAGQLAAGVAGHVIAVRQRRSFDIALLAWRGRPDRVARDALLYGTGLSAPAWMLAAQLIAIGQLAARPSQPAAQMLGILGAGMTVGYLVEREFRQAMRPKELDPVLTAIAAAGFGLAVPMAVLGLRAGSSD